MRLKLPRRSFLSSAGAVTLTPVGPVIAQTAAQSSGRPIPVKSRFVRVGARNVHYLRAGQGPAIVLLHGTPGEASQFEPDIADLSGKYSVFAFDTPGYGLSDPMPESQRDVAFLADATAEAMRVLKLPP